MATFLPLTVSLIAITSRVQFLLVDVRSSIVSYWEVVMRILEVTTVSLIVGNCQILTASQLPVGLKLDRRALLLPPDVESGTTSSARPRKKDVDHKAEDLGNKVPRDLVEGSRVELMAAPASSATIFNLSMDRERHSNSFLVPAVPPFTDHDSHMDNMATIPSAT